MRHIAYDFLAQVHVRMEELGLSQRDLAKKLGVTDGRVSQVFTDASNLGVIAMVRWAEALGMTPTIVLITEKENRPHVSPNVLRRCWQELGYPESADSVEMAARNTYCS